MVDRRHIALVFYCTGATQNPPVLRARVRKRRAYYYKFCAHVGKAHKKFGETDVVAYGKAYFAQMGIIYDGGFPRCHKSVFVKDSEKVDFVVMRKFPAI